MKIAICDDEEFFCNTLKKQIQDILHFHNLTADTDLFFSGEALLESETEYNIIFLDCKMSGIDGVNAAIQIKNKYRNTCIIFISAYPEFAIPGYEAEALRFLLKPISSEKLNEAINAYIKKFADKCQVSFKSGNKELVISSSDIIYIESLKRKSIVRLHDASYETKKSLDTFAKEITDINFYRSHRRYIVNISQITSFKDNHIYTSNGEQVEISMRKLSNFKKFYIEYLKRS